MEKPRKKLTKKQIKQLLTLLLILVIIAWRIWGPADDAALPESDIPDAPASSSAETLAESPADSPAAPENEPESDPDPPAEEAAPAESDPVESTPAQPEEPADEEPADEEPADEEPAIDEDGSYTTKEDVALYIYTYGRLPDNFITKDEARDLGWEGGGLEKYAPGCCIGGDRFGNYEGLLPTKKGRSYTECDIDTMGAKKRGAKRIVFSNDGLIYYTDDHYESFTLLYGEE